MTRYWPLLLLLSAAWGASYLFIKIAVEDIPPGPLGTARLLAAGALLLAYLVATAGREAALRGLWATRRHALVLGVLNGALPFWLIPWGEQHIDSGLAAVVQASVPIFNALLVLRFLPHERLDATRAAGLGAGLLGVAVVTGVHPEGDALAIAGALAVVLSSVSYAGAGVYGQLAVSDASGPVLAASSMLCGGVVLAPVAALQLPDEAPGLPAVGALAALTLIGTVLAQLLLFRMLRLHGSARLSLVAYLLPAFALVYGAVFLDERITASTLGGGALILGGVALASGAVRLRRREAAAVRS